MKSPISPSIIIYRRNFIERFIAKVLLKLYGSEMPPPCNIGKGVFFPHGLNGIVLHPSTIIKDNVTIFHQVTCGRGDMFHIDKRVKNTSFQGIVIEEGAVLCAGAKIICNRGVLVVGKNTIVGANAVLTHSTGEDEIWAGVPARLIKKRIISDKEN